MKPEEIIAQYSAIISRYKEASNRAQFIYTDAEKQFSEELAELQAKCEHRAPVSEFIDGVSCPYCRKVM